MPYRHRGPLPPRTQARRCPLSTDTSACDQRVETMHRTQAQRCPLSTDTSACDQRVETMHRMPLVLRTKVHQTAGTRSLLGTLGHCQPMPGNGLWLGKRTTWARHRGSPGGSCEPRDAALVVMWYATNMYSTTFRASSFHCFFRSAFTCAPFRFPSSYQVGTLPDRNATSNPLP